MTTAKAMLRGGGDNERLGKDMLYWGNSLTNSVQGFGTRPQMEAFVFP